MNSFPRNAKKHGTKVSFAIGLAAPCLVVPSGNTGESVRGFMVVAREVSIPGTCAAQRGFERSSNTMG